MNRIKFLREEKGIYQKDLAKLLNVSIPAINYYENEKRSLDTKSALILAEYFNVSVDYLLGKSNIRNSESINKINLKIPVLGIVKAGYDFLADENIIGYVTVNDNKLKNEDFFALKVKGNSMVPEIYEDDIAIVKKQSDFENGDYVVALINGDEATIKKVIKTNEGIELHAMNPYYPIKKFTFEDMKNIPVKIIGRVKEAKIKGAFK